MNKHTIIKMQEEQEEQEEKQEEEQEEQEEKEEQEEQEEKEEKEEQEEQEEQEQEQEEKEEKEEQEEQEQEEQEQEEKEEENIIRIISKNILEYTSIDTTLGIIYTYIHLLYSFLLGFIFLFNNNLIHLFFVLIIISLNAFSIVVLHGCPLTHLEKKYLNTSSCSKYYDFFRNSKIMYKCDHDYEKQIEMLINVFLLIVLKFLTIIVIRTFNLKLYNYNNIYE